MSSNEGSGESEQIRRHVSVFAAHMHKVMDLDGDSALVQLDSSASMVKEGFCAYALTYWLIVFGPRREKTRLRGFPNNKGANQPAHPRRLISLCFLLTGQNHF